MGALPLKISFLGLSITSSWGNGHATTYRGLVRELAARGHEVLFLERDTPWYAGNRDMPQPPYGHTALYFSVEELFDRFGEELRTSDAVIVGSFVPEGAVIGEWVTSQVRGLPAFYDIDTPVTLAMLAAGEEWYLTRALIPRYQLYLSFSGGKTLRELEQRYGSPCARALYCSVDPELYYPESVPQQWDMGYLGTYSEDRQPALERLLLEPARQWPGGRFMVAGPKYPEELVWPANVQREIHLAPAEHRRFYNAQRFTLSVTRADMLRAGHSPSVRLFEASACGTPIITDPWPGLEEFLTPGREVLVATSTEESLGYLQAFSEEAARHIGAAARGRVLAHHTAAHRAQELEQYLRERLEARTTIPFPRPSTQARASQKRSTRA